MDARQQKGLALAKCKGIKRVEGAMWQVPSQSQNAGGYLVNVLAASCTCPDHELRRTKCKHQWAVELFQTLEIETAPDGTTTVTETVAVRRRKTYKQDWPAYNAAQCEEKDVVQTLLHGLCQGILTPPHPGRGPKPIPLADVVFGMTMKVYTTLSGRRATTDMKVAGAAGHLSRVPSYNALFSYFEKPELSPLLSVLVEESAAPLAAIETKIAVDSTSFTTAPYRRWFDEKYGREMKEHTWVKAHAACGALTNVITAVNVTPGTVNDTPELPALVQRTAMRFDIADVVADKAYLSHKNLAAIEEVGAVPYIPFKLNSRSDGPAAWKRMWGLFMYEQARFLEHYHARSNAESTFSAIKRKFGPNVRSRLYAAQKNEVLCKVIAHNLSCLVHAIRELKIEEPVFRAQLQLPAAS